MWLSTRGIMKLSTLSKKMDEETAHSDSVEKKIKIQIIKVRDNEKRIPLTGLFNF